MATHLENLETARDNIAAKLAEVSVNPKPSYTIDGQSVQWADYFRMLNDQLKNLYEQIAKAEPFELHTRSDS